MPCSAGMASAQQSLSVRWDDHVKYEFATRNTDDTLETMVVDAYVNHVPVMTGGVGHDELREFYSQRFIPQMPPDTAMTPVSRTIGIDRGHTVVTEHGRDVGAHGFEYELPLLIGVQADQSLP